MEIPAPKEKATFLEPRNCFPKSKGCIDGCVPITWETLMILIKYINVSHRSWSFDSDKIWLMAKLTSAISPFHKNTSNLNSLDYVTGLFSLMPL